MYQQGQTEAALFAYTRVIFFDTTFIYSGKSFERTADLFASQQKHELAEYYYDLALNNASNDSARLEISLKNAQSLLKAHKAPKAVMELLTLGDGGSIAQSKRKDFFLGVAYFNWEKFEESEKYFLSSTAGDEKKQQKIKELFERNKKVSSKNPRTAKVLSIILPGLGQAYVGDYKNAANSFLLTGAFVALYIYSSVNFGLIDAYISVFPWFNRYYMGGIKKAQTLANMKIAERRNKIYLEILNTFKQ